MARILKDFIKSSKDFDSQYDDYIEDRNHEIESNPQYQYYYDDNGNLFQVPRDSSDLVDEFGLDQPMDLSYPYKDFNKISDILLDGELYLHDIPVDRINEYMNAHHNDEDYYNRLEKIDNKYSNIRKNLWNSKMAPKFRHKSESEIMGYNIKYDPSFTSNIGFINNNHRLENKYNKIAKRSGYSDDLKSYFDKELAERRKIAEDEHSKIVTKYGGIPGKPVTFHDGKQFKKLPKGAIILEHAGDSIGNGDGDTIGFPVSDKYGDYMYVRHYYDGKPGEYVDSFSHYGNLYFDKNHKLREDLKNQLSNFSKDMSEPEKYSEEWFEKNNINPYTSIPARMANKALEAENEAWRKHSSSNEDKVYKDYFGKDPYHYWDALEKFPKPKRYRGTWAGPGYTNNKYERDRILKGIREVKSNKHKIINDYDTKYPNGYHLGPENGGFTNTGKKEYESELKEWTNRLRDYKLSQRPYFKKLKRLENQYESNLNDPKFKEYKKNLLGDYPLEVGNRAIAEQYKLAEQKGLVNPDQNIYTGTRYMKLPDGFKEVDGAHDYIVLAKPIDDHTIKEIEYDNGKKHERIIRPNSDSYYNDWYFDENGKMKDWLKVQKDMSSGTFYVNTLRNPNLFYPVEYKKNPFRKVKAVYRADQPNIGYDYDKILNDETDEEYNKYLPIHNQAINDITQINLKGITEDELNLAINELAKKYPNKRFEINVKYKDMSMLNGLFR